MISTVFFLSIIIKRFLAVKMMILTDFPQNNDHKFHGIVVIDPATSNLGEKTRPTMPQEKISLRYFSLKVVFKSLIHQKYDK